jgi:hypothetical protein
MTLIKRIFLFAILLLITYGQLIIYANFTAPSVN